MSDGSVRAIDAAFRLYLLPQGVFSVAISTVLFPTISRLAARDDIGGHALALARGLRQIFFMLLPASAFLLVLSEPVVRLVFQRGEFDAQSTSLTSEALVFFAIGLAFNGASLLVIRAFFSLQLPWLATKVAALGVVLNAALDAIFYQPLGTGGIPLSTSHLERRDLRGDAVPARSASSGGCTAPGWSDGALRSLVAEPASSALLAWSSWQVLDDALGQSVIGAARQHRPPRWPPPRSPTSRRRRPSTSRAGARWRGWTAATMRGRGPGPHPQLLHHRPHRPWQVDAGGPHPRAHRHASSEREMRGQVLDSMDLERERGHHDQGPGRAHALHGVGRR